MRVAVLSDSHANVSQVQTVIARLQPRMQGVERIIHAGDFTAPEMLEALSAVAPVHAVAGNMDGAELHDALPEQVILELAGYKVGLIHGWGAPADLPRRVYERFLDPDRKPKVDLIVFGHSHEARIERHAGVLLLNPGSPTDRRFAPYRSLAILDLAGEPKAEIIRL